MLRWDNDKSKYFLRDDNDAQSAKHKIIVPLLPQSRSREQIILTLNFVHIFKLFATITDCSSRFNYADIM